MLAFYNFCPTCQYAILAAMNSYELTLVLDGKLGVAKKKKVIEELTKVLKIFKGAIKESKEWGVKELAYDIKSGSKKGKSETGLFMNFELDLDPKNLKALNDKLRTNEDVLRYLVVKKEK